MTTLTFDIGVVLNSRTPRGHHPFHFHQHSWKPSSSGSKLTPSNASAPSLHWKLTKNRQSKPQDRVWQHTHDCHRKVCPETRRASAFRGGRWKSQGCSEACAANGRFGSKTGGTLIRNRLGFLSKRTGTSHLGISWFSEGPIFP